MRRLEVAQTRHQAVNLAGGPGERGVQLGHAGVGLGARRLGLGQLGAQRRVVGARRRKLRLQGLFERGAKGR